MSAVHFPPHSPQPQPAKKLRPCLSPVRRSSPEHDPIGFRPSSAGSNASSVYTECSNGEWIKRSHKTVRWQNCENGSAVTSYFSTWSANEYDRTPLAPPSQAERACALPARNSRCLSFLDEDDDAEADEDDDVADSDEEAIRRLPPSPFATPEDSDSECDRDDEWDECFERRRMMFARMCPLSDDDAQPQFEGYRSLSATLVNLLKQVGCDEEGGDEDDCDTPRASFHERCEEQEEASSEDASSDPAEAAPKDMFPLFRRLREDSADSDAATPSLVSSADSDIDYAGLVSPRGSAVDFLPGNNNAPLKGLSPVRGAYGGHPTTTPIEL